ncbi:MAG: type I-B CRISPR-associated protein Cas7/Cst2/DevR [Nitrososphaerales archaeon]
MRAKFLELAFLTKVEKSNLNASGTEGNVTILKKTEEIDGGVRPFISGASIKYAIKDYLKEIGLPLSPIKRKTKTAQITTECDPEKYIDDDLFGYMDTEKGVRRIAPVKTNGMISIFERKGDLNRGVRFDPEGKEHSMYDLEVATTVFRSNWAIELDRIGHYNDEQEFKEGKVGDFINAKEKEKRVKALLGAIFNLWSRVKQTNNLTQLQPEVMIVVMRDDKSLTIGDKLRVDQQLKLDCNALGEALRYHNDRVKEAYLGFFASFIKNVDEINKMLANALNKRLRIMELVELKRLLLSEAFNFYA